MHNFKFKRDNSYPTDLGPPISALSRWLKPLFNSLVHGFEIWHQQTWVQIWIDPWVLQKWDPSRLTPNHAMKFIRASLVDTPHSGPYNRTQLILI